MSNDHYANLESLDPDFSIWERVYTVSPLVLVGTVDGDGNADLAPKHMAFPLGWENYFGFVCTPRHATYANISQSGEFTVSYPRPSAVVTASLAASPRCEDSKPVLGALETFPARQVNGIFAADSYCYLECKHIRTIDGFGDNSLIAGRVIAAHVDRDALRTSDRDDADLMLGAPQLAYFFPDRFAVIEETRTFPLPAGMRR